MKVKRKMEHTESIKSLHFSKTNVRDAVPGADTSTCAHTQVSNERHQSTSTTNKTDPTYSACETKHETDIVQGGHDYDTTELRNNQDSMYEDDGYASASSTDRKAAQPRDSATETTAQVDMNTDGSTSTTARFGKLSISRHEVASTSTEPRPSGEISSFQGPGPSCSTLLADSKESVKRRRGHLRRHYSHSVSVQDARTVAQGTTAFDVDVGTGAGIGTGIRTLLLPEMVRAKGVKLISPTALITDTRMRSHTYPCAGQGVVDDDHAGQTRGHRRTLSMPAHLWQVQHQPPLDFFIRHTITGEAQEGAHYTRDTDLDTFDTEYTGLHYGMTENTLEDEDYPGDIPLLGFLAGGGGGLDGGHDHHAKPPRAGYGSSFRTSGNGNGTATHPVRLVFKASEVPLEFAFEEESELVDSPVVERGPGDQDGYGDIIIEAWVVDDDSSATGEAMMDLGGEGGGGAGEFSYPLAFGGGGIPFGIPDAQAMHGFAFDDELEDDDDGEEAADALFHEAMMSRGVMPPFLFDQRAQGMLASAMHDEDEEEDEDEDATGELDFNFLPALHHLDPRHPLASIVELEENEDEQEPDVLDETMPARMRLQGSCRPTGFITRDEHEEMAFSLDAATERQALHPEQYIYRPFGAHVDRFDGAIYNEDDEDDGDDGDEDEEDDMEFNEMMMTMMDPTHPFAHDLFAHDLEDDFFQHHAPPMLERGSSPFAKYIKEVRPYHSDGYYAVSAFKADNGDEGIHCQETLCEYQGRVYRAERGTEKRALKRKVEDIKEDGQKGTEEGTEESRIKSMLSSSVSSSSLHGCRPRSALDRRVGCWRRLKEVK